MRATGNEKKMFASGTPVVLRYPNGQVIVCAVNRIVPLVYGERHARKSDVDVRNAGLCILTGDGWCELCTIRKTDEEGEPFDLILSNSSINAVHRKSACIDTHGHVVPLNMPCIRGLHHAFATLGNIRTRRLEKKGTCLSCTTPEALAQAVCDVREASEDMDLDRMHALMSEIVSSWTVEQMQRFVNAISQRDPFTRLRRFPIPDLITGQYVYILYALCGLSPSVYVEPDADAHVKLVVTEQDSSRDVHFFNEVRDISSYAYTGTGYTLETSSPNAGIVAGLGSLIVV